jgi:trehalose-6-phosphatase
MCEDKDTNKSLDVTIRNDLVERYRRAKRRLLLLDYDGTLTPYFHVPSLARPDNLLLDLLDSLGSDPRNSVYVLSSRDPMTMQKWLGHLPVNLSDADKTKKIIAEAGDHYDFILAIGDDPVDEALFEELAGLDQAFTIKVGADPSSARYAVSNTRMVIALLAHLL